MASHYSRNHLQDDWDAMDSADRAERIEAAEIEAGKAFDDATKTQKSEYDAAIASLIGVTGPRYDRARQAAKDSWLSSTATARELYGRTVDELLATGEISEELSFAWDEVNTDHRRALQAAE